MNELDELRLKVAKARGWRVVEDRPFWFVHDGRNLITSSAYTKEEWAHDGMVKQIPDWPRDWAAAGALLEEMVNGGICPALLFDDNGHWALTTEGAQNTPEGDGPQDIYIAFYVEACHWFDTAPEAITRAYLAWKEAQA